MHPTAPRLAPIAPGTRPELADQEVRIAAARGRISGLYQVLLNSPPIAHGWEQMLSAVRNHSSLSAAVRELVILRVAVLNRAPYEFDAHVPHALAAGVSQAAIDATRVVPPAADSPWSDAERVALELADTMTRDIEVPDALFARVEAVFQGQQLLDLVATVAAYNMVSRLLVALRVGH
ncbi:carboxymuconolactone decarboxylase family protein [Hydrogenophaga sp.]|uniref:carboxymuconolactone decarboxylase family protein n=1 Tax=Hydrogenophaga sp. TaxID=1904254 RepID=UPI00271BE006|nr:carboxymuconolactone decarboxylase family protein [Hydrogenophaga sp.]MDO9436412.1 carboxymuconolactone decarboxylase family protein [Hydrogenophaga sp.]